MLIGAIFRDAFNMGSKAQFLGHFGPQSKSNFLCLVTFTKSLYCFFISIASHAHLKYFSMCGEYGPQRPDFWATSGPKISENYGLWSFSQKFSIGLTLVLVYTSIWATFGGVLKIGLWGPISGSFWATKFIIVQVFSHFLNYFPLVLHHSCFTFC